MCKWIVGITLCIILFVGIWLGWAMYALEIAHWIAGTENSWTEAGSWGDSFGAFNAFFGAAGFAVVIATLILQGRSIRSQREDLYRERFEGTYFQLLEMLRVARNEVRFKQSIEYFSTKIAQNNQTRNNPQIKVGLDAFREAMTEFLYWLQQSESDTCDDKRIKFSKLYKKRIHSRYESTFGSYFRLLYNILDRVDSDTSLSEDEKRKYGNLIRGHMTSFEVGVAGFNALMEEAKDFDRLIIRFRLLKYYPKGFVRNILEDVYPEKTFQGRDRDGKGIQLEADPLEQAP